MTERPRLSIGEARVNHTDVARVARGELSVALTEQPSWHDRMQRSRQAVDARARSSEPFYGVNTGFGASVVNTVGVEYGGNLAANLFRFHGCGLGPVFRLDETRAIIVARLAQLAAGWSGIRAETLRAMTLLLHHDILPCIPELGSVGASGDLTPMSYVAAVLCGEREVVFRGATCPAAEALAAAGLPPLTLQPKETLSIMNGTSVMTALVSLALDRAEAFARAHAMVTAWNSFVLRGQPAHFDERLFLAKPHPGSVRYAGWVRAHLGCGPRPALGTGKVQDPYSVRCTPHVVGVLLEVLDQAAATVEIELNGAGDNPLICEHTQAVLHGGNFYGSHITHVADTLKVQLAHAAELLERQLVLLCHSTQTSGIPENLIRVAGPGQTAHHGFKAVEILASGLVAEAMKLAAPASVFSRSTEGHNQDKVPMGPIAARDLRAIQSLADHMLAISLLAAAQATDATDRAAALPPALRALYTAIREICPATVEDQRHDLLITRCLAAYHAGQLPGLG
ncbi:MAG TPA: aromatic amino acid ammonia-lyase [Kofleriaceae bacterium]|nr:aromatic amino acid ammonia-lyase [Kofleriaceae bacterium]